MTPPWWSRQCRSLGQCRRGGFAEVPVGTGSIRWRNDRAAGGADGLVPASQLSAHACAFASKGDRDAIADYTKAIETRPLSAGAYFRRGIVYRTKGRQRSRHREL